ncbi:methyl-accepting chemotaxis protein [Sphingomonas sp. ID0503]|uniref:methyl-accepting chemotaxis protein n=1 Tax=Sphingomonas sp. ID0503 TaxID=3399691 RepID=UPI003AFA9252
MIRGIADKVRMLSINASIEAARAGAAGQGFGVVAQEIKALAGQTRTAAASIGDRVGGVCTVIDEVAFGHDGMAGAVGRVDSATTVIDAAITGQRLAIHDIAAAVEQAAGAGEGILSDLSEMNERAKVALLNSGRIQSMAGRLADNAGALNGSVGRFIAEVAV